jgi:ABC-2 type transport system ATP-binding protein
MITVSHLSKSFGTVKAVDDLSFSVKPGEILGFLGPNGAGKTTTMRLLTGFLSADSGSITVNNISVENNPVSAQTQIGYLPENNPLYKDMLISEILQLSARLKHIPHEDLHESLEFVVNATGIKEVYFRPIAELSKGYKQRVGIAIALLAQPKILIMDEPTEGLDPNQRAEIRNLVKKLAKNHTIIMSTHVMQEVEAVCNRMLIINNGKLVADGTPEELTRTGKNKHILLVELEGPEVSAHLKKLIGKEGMEIEKISGNRFRIKLSSSSKTPLQPEISKLANQYNWIIWKMAEEEQKLEDVFHLLTS